MMVNLNNAPNSGPLTAEELDRYRNLHRVTLPGIDIDAAHKRPYIAQGLDMQGRRPQAAEAATDLGAEQRNARPLPWYVAELVGVPPAIVTTMAAVAAVAAIVGVSLFVLI
jgi:hypothetical protein